MNSKSTINTGSGSGNKLPLSMLKANEEKNGLKLVKAHRNRLEEKTKHYNRVLNMSRNKRQWVFEEMCYDMGMRVVPYEPEGINWIAAEEAICQLETYLYGLCGLTEKNTAIEREIGRVRSMLIELKLHLLVDTKAEIGLRQITGYRQKVRSNIYTPLSAKAI